MSATRTATRKEMIFIGVAAATAGLYFMPVGAGILPVPGGPRNLHAPLWVVVCAGLAFFLGGLAMFVQAIGKANESGDLPANAPQWLRVVQYLIGVAIFVSFALVGTWIAIGGEAGQFSGSVGGLSGGVGVGIGRTVFGIGAIITWLGTIFFAVSGARKLLRGHKSARA
jgi:putative effector of murein hydrolase LrgA (UPF0299 family)